MPVVNVDLDAWLADTLGGAGNGKGDRMCVGKGLGASDWPWENRLAMRVPRPAEFATISSADQITGAWFNLRASSAVIGIGGSVHFWLKRASSGTFTENSESRREFVTTSGPASSEYPGPTTTDDDAAEFDPASNPVNNEWIKVHALDLARWWWANPSVTSLIVVGVADDETATGQRCTFYTRESGSKPTFEFTYTTVLPPNAPSDLNPPENATIGSTFGTEADVQARHTDPAGLAATKYQAQWWPSAATDDENGNVSGATVTKDQTVTTTTAHNALRTHKFTGLAARTGGKWRMRFFNGTSWGPWSRLRAASTAYKPSVVNRTVQPGTLTPLLYASIQSNDPNDFITAIREIIEQDDPSFGTITKWDSGKQAVGGSPTRSETTYGGSALVYGTQYRRRTVLWNRDDVASDTTGNQLFTQSEPIGAAIDPSDTSVKLDSLTPTFTLSDPAANDIDQARLRLWGDEARTIALFDSGTQSFAADADRDIAVTSGILDWGMDVWVDGAVRVSGNAVLGPYSQPKKVHVNARPGPPTGMVVSGGQTVLRSDGVWVTTDSTPDILFPFRDTDVDLGYDETPESQTVEIRDDAEAPFGGSPITDSSSPSETFTSPTLTVEETYDFRALYEDTAAVEGPFSERVYVKHSAEPELSDVSPADTDVITDPTPTFSATYSHSGSVAEASRRLYLRDGDTIVYDSGEVDPDDITVPAFTLENETDYDYELVSTNEDGLQAIATGTITTDFTQPDMVEGLTLTPNTETMSIDAAWTASDLTDDEFEAYRVFVKPEGGQWRLVATLTDKADTSIAIRAAGHNRETNVRVTQSNGWLESEPAEASAALGSATGDTSDDDFVHGYWDVGEDGAFELKHIRHQDEPHALREVLEPPGRGEPVILDWGATGYSGSFTLLTHDRELVDRLRAYFNANTVRLFKTPYGVSRYVRYTSVPASDDPGLWIGATVSYREVAASNANF